MKYHLMVWILILLMLLSITACEKTPQTKALILTSVYPYELLIRDMVGTDIEVKSIIPANSSPHTWSPVPSDLKAVDNADLIVVNGLDLENVIAKTLALHKDKTIVLAELAKITPLGDDDGGHAGDDHPTGHEAEIEHEAGHHHEQDPHIWTSPKNLILMANALKPVLRDKFPAHADSISARSDRLIKALTDLDIRITRERTQLSHTNIITYHNSFAYFFRDYQMDRPETVQSSPGKEPGPREMNDLSAKIKAKGITAIYVEPQMSRKSAEILASEFKLRILTLDPLGQSLAPAGSVDLISKNWSAMKQGMNGQK